MSHFSPPKWILKLFEWLCPDGLSEGLLGDFLEKYDEDRLSISPLRANFQLLKSVLCLTHPSMIFRNRIQFKYMNFSLVANNLKVLVRSLSKYKFYGFVNIFGLVLAITFVLVSFLFIRSQLGFDEFHERGERIYRVLSYESESGYSAITPIPIGPALKSEVVGIEEFVRFGSGSATVFKDQTPFSETITYLDPEFIKVFSFPIIYGSQKALEQNSGLVITPDMAEKYFNNTDPIGEELRMKINDSTMTFLVTGVISSRSEESSIQFDFVLPFEVIDVMSPGAWNSFNVAFSETYLLMDHPPQYNMSEVLSSAILKNRGSNKDEWIVDLQPLNKIHLDPESDGLAISSDKKQLWILGSLSLLILLVALVNYISLSVGQTLTRIKELGLRKTFGSNNVEIRRQLLFESTLMAALACALALATSSVILPFFTDLFDYSLPLTLDVISIGFIVLLGLFIGIICGIFQDVAIRQSYQADRVGKQQISNVLMVFQFMVALLLVLGTFVIKSQMDHIQNMNLGFDQEHVVTINMHSGQDQEASKAVLQKFKSTMSTIPGVKEISGTMNDYQNPWTELSFRQVDESEITTKYNQVSPNFINTMGIEILEGRDFRAGGNDERNAIIVNESLVKELGFNDPLSERIPGKKLDNSHEIIGVVKDFNFGSAHEKIKPLILALDMEPIGKGITGLSTYVWPSNLNTILVRLEGGNVQEQLASLEMTWRSISPETPFQFHFLDETINAVYREESRWNKLISYASIYALIIGWIGLLGFTRLSLQKRVKEIGIRRVLGSSGVSIILLISRKHLVQLLVAVAFTWPTGWWLMTTWLESFEYRISLSPFMFMGSLAAVLFVIFGSVGVQSLRASLQDPVESLRYE